MMSLVMERVMGWWISKYVMVLGQVVCCLLQPSIFIQLAIKNNKLETNK